MRKWIREVKGLAEEVGITQQGLRQTWFPKTGFPKKTKRGWNVEKVLQFMDTWKRAQVGNQTGEDADLKRRKLLGECETIEEKLAQLRREAIPLSEHHNELREFAAILNNGLASWVQEVQAVTRDAKMVKMAKRARDRVRKQILGALE